MREEPKSESRYLVKYYIPTKRPVKRRKFHYTSIPVSEEIGKKVAMGLAEKLWADLGGKIKAVSAEYQTGVVTRTFQQHHPMPLPPEIQAAIHSHTNANVDGDHYNATIETLASLGYTKGERLSFKDPSIKGVSYHNETHRVDVSKADFLGVFTDIQFHTL
jgi:hypothetical protein